MREALHRSDLALYTHGPAGIEVQLQSYDIIRCCAVWPGNSGRLKNFPLAANSNFWTNDVPPA